MSAGQQSLNAVKLALQNLAAKQARSGYGEMPFLDASIGLRTSDLAAVVGMAELLDPNLGRCAFCDTCDIPITSAEEHMRACSKHPLGAALAELAAAEALNAAQLEEMAKVTEENARLRREMPTADQMIINRNDYERLIASLPAGPRVVR